MSSFDAIVHQGLFILNLTGVTKWSRRWFYPSIVGSTRNSLNSFVLGVSQQKLLIYIRLSQLTNLVSLCRTLLYFRSTADNKHLILVLTSLLGCQTASLFFHFSPSSFSALFIAHFTRPLCFGPIMLWVLRKTRTGSVRPVSISSRPFGWRFLPFLYWRPNVNRHHFDLRVSHCRCRCRCSLNWSNKSMRFFLKIRVNTILKSSQFRVARTATNGCHRFCQSHTFNYRLTNCFSNILALLARQLHESTCQRLLLHFQAAIPLSKCISKRSLLELTCLLT